MITTNGCFNSPITCGHDQQISDKANRSDIQCFGFVVVRIPKKDINDDRRRHFQPCSTRPHTRGIDVIKLWVLYPLITRTPSLALVLRCIKVRVVCGVIRYMPPYILLSSVLLYKLFLTGIQFSLFLRYP